MLGGAEKGGVELGLGPPARNVSCKNPTWTTSSIFSLTWFESADRKLFRTYGIICFAAKLAVQLVQVCVECGYSIAVVIDKSDDSPLESRLAKSGAT